MNAKRSSKARLLNVRLASTCAVPSAHATRMSTHITSIRVASLIHPRPKSDKYPEGYLGHTEETFPLARREMRSIRTHVRWNCEKCETLFKDTEKTCGNCGHEKCDGCPRYPPKRVGPTLDDDAVKSVEEKMRTLDVSPQASAA